MTDQDLIELRARNEERLKAFKETMGTKYLLHPENHVKKKRRQTKKNKSAMKVIN